MRIFFNLIIGFIFLIPTWSNAQKGIVLQTDLLDPIAKGGSLWINYDTGRHRIFTAGGRNVLPDFLNPDGDNFSENRNFFLQLGYGYRIGKKHRWIAGGQLLYTDMTAEAKEAPLSGDLSVFRICPIVFYEWNFLKSFPAWSLTPWASYRVDVLRQKVEFPSIGKSYSSALGNFAMGFNLGYAF